jgi:hypothetical protein
MACMMGSDHVGLHAQVDRVSMELNALREGLYDVISPGDLSDLTAEDLQLLLSGRVRLLPPCSISRIAA